MELNELLQGLLSEVNRIAKSDAVVGEVRDAGKSKVLPLSKISVGFGVGVAGVDGTAKRDKLKGDADIQGGGAGGAVSVEPKAFVVVGEDGVPHMLAFSKGKKAVLRRGLEILPQAAQTSIPEAVQAVKALGTGTMQAIKEVSESQASSPSATKTKAGKSRSEG